MAETKERRKTPRKLQSVTPKPDSIRRSEASADDIRKLIAEAAYYKAKERGFQPGHELLTLRPRLLDEPLSLDEQGLAHGHVVLRGHRARR